MENEKFGGKLSLNKETISVLNQNEMDSAKGGFTSLLCLGAVTYGVYLITKQVDIDTIGHDDGPDCVSTDGAWYCNGI